MNLSFEKLLDNETKRISDNFLKDIKLEKSIEKHKSINYSLKDLLINCSEEDIRALIYYFSKELKKMKLKKMKSKKIKKLKKKI